MSMLKTVRILCSLGGAVIFGMTALIAFETTPENETRLRETGSCPGCDLFGARLAGIQAQNADLTGANLGEADFYGGNLQGANLTNAVLDAANLKMVNLEGAIGVVFSTAVTDERTICPNGSPGPCE